jgi:hypothetical protein
VLWGVVPFEAFDQPRERFHDQARECRGHQSCARGGLSEELAQGHGCRCWPHSWKCNCNHGAACGARRDIAGTYRFRRADRRRGWNIAAGRYLPITGARRRSKWEPERPAVPSSNWAIGNQVRLPLRVKLRKARSEHMFSGLIPNNGHRLQRSSPLACP